MLELLLAFSFLTLASCVAVYETGNKWSTPTHTHTHTHINSRRGRNPEACW